MRSLSLTLSIVLALAAGAGCATAGQKPAASSVSGAGDGLKVERVVMLMRHSVRPPTKAEVTPAGWNAQPWSAWTTPFGELTPHGGEGARLMGVYERASLGQRGLLPASGCPQPGDITVWASGKSRAIVTAQQFAEGMYPGCGVVVDHPQDEANDPVFHPAGGGAWPIDGERAKAATLARLPKGGMAEVYKDHAKEIAILERVIGYGAPPACAKAPCRLSDLPTTIEAASNDGPDMLGMLGVASTAGQVVTLEYVEGKPLSEVGWGRPSKADITAIQKFHTLKFYYEARTPYVADRYAAPVASKILSALQGGEGTGKLTMLVGHDTNIAMLGGMLDLHWQAADYAADDPPPGGALGFELVSNAKGEKFVRAFYQAQSMDQLRNLTPLTLEAPPYRGYIAIPGCSAGKAMLCPLGRFEAIVKGKLEHPAE